jgi:hypothetical protein
VSPVLLSLDFTKEDEYVDTRKFFWLLVIEPVNTEPGPFLWQDPAHGLGVRAVLERIELGAGLAGIGFGSRGAL